MRVVTPRWASSLRVWRVSSQATRSASASALASRGEASSRFPMGVAQTVSLPSFIRGRLLDDLVVGGLPLLELLAGEGDDRELGLGRRVDGRVLGLLGGQQGLGQRHRGAVADVLVLVPRLEDVAAPALGQPG